MAKVYWSTKECDAAFSLHSDKSPSFTGGRTQASQKSDIVTVINVLENTQMYEDNRS